MKINPVRGTHDLFGEEINKFNKVVAEVKNISQQFGFNELITPIFESSELFKKPLGEQSDVVLKEMYTFNDRNEDEITLRPEYTTPMIRAAISNGLLNNLPAKFYGTGQMFRRERPQKGRQRQFHQFGVEAFGSNNPEQDVEIISIAWRIILQCGLENETTLNLNSIGSRECRDKYRIALKDYIQPYLKDFSQTSQHRFETNPLRILDTKSEKEQNILKGAPKISDYHTENDSSHFNSLIGFLKNMNIPFSINHKLVRGLDYYTGTVFEFNSHSLGAQDALLGGGRYNDLVEILGGKSTPGIGFAAGVERFLIAMEQSGINTKESSLDIYFVCVGEKALPSVLEISKKLREIGLKVISDTLRRSIKSQLREANKLEAKYALMIGENEIKDNNLILKDLSKGIQKTILQSEVINFFEDLTN